MAVDQQATAGEPIPRDASMQVLVDPEGMEAYLHLRAAEGGGAPITRDAVLAALADQGVTEGILDDDIDSALAAGLAEGTVIARGQPPFHGADGYLESLVPEVRSRVPRVDETGHTDYRDLGAIQVVHAGEALMRRHPPTPGTPGRSLLGRVLPARPGKEVMFAAKLEGAVPAPGDPNLLQAAITGQPVAVRGGMMVEPVYRLASVGTGSGNIEFEGSVVVEGDVAAGMRVRATGDIEVGGVVENATLEAGGSVVIKGGAMGSLGRKSGGEHHIRCGGCFNAAYVQQARIEAGDSIFVDDLVMQGELSAVNHIRVGHQRRGHIVGGTLQATLSITAKVIGSPNRARTTLEIGVNPLMHQQLLALAKDRDGKETQLLEVSKLLDLADRVPGKLPPAMVAKARATAAALSAAIAELREAQEDLTRKIDLSLTARVVAEQAIHEGTEVILGGQRYRVAGEHAAFVVGLDGNGVLDHLTEVDPVTAAGTAA
jgi:hypothetical protein